MSKLAGQHAANPFECARLRLKSFNTHRVAHPTAELRAKTLLAIEESKRYPELRSHMQRLREHAQTHAVQSRAAVVLTLSDVGLL